MNLRPSHNRPWDHRPHQNGRARGIILGRPAALGLEWTIDTGADISVVQKEIGDAFELQPIAASAKTATGGGGILVKTGMDVEFSAEDGGGQSRLQICGGHIGVKSNNAGGNLLGMEQLALSGVRIEWDPYRQSGSLTI